MAAGSGRMVASSDTRLIITVLSLAEDLHGAISFE